MDYLLQRDSQRVEPWGSSETGETLERVWQQIDADLDAHIGTIQTYLRQPSVSGTGEGIEQGAVATADLLEHAGGVAEVVPTSGHPAVLGSLDGAGPRLLRYFMYDVQPAEEDDWTSPPFAAEIHDLPDVGRSIVARGSANSKGCLAAFLLAIESLKKVAEMPVSIGFVCDGEEELGSPNLPAVFEQHRDRLAADAVLDLDLTADRWGTPEVYLGCKGILSLRLTCRGGDWGGPIDRALHSSQGVVIASPAWSLVRALRALVDDDESVRVPGLASGSVPPEDKSYVDALVEGFDGRGHLIEAGATRFKGDIDAYEVVTRMLYGVAANVNGMRAGYPEGGKTIIPHEADAILDLRVPYGTDPQEIEDSTRAWLAENVPEVEVDFPEFCPPAKTSPSSAVAKAMIASHDDIGKPARVWPSAPWWAPYYLFEQNLDLPFAVGGAGHAARSHASDEYATLEGLREHMKQSMAFLFRFAEESGKEGRRVG